MKSTFQGLGFILAVIVMTVGAALGADPVAPPSGQPLAAFALGQCSKALALFVVIDAEHVVRFSQAQTSMFVKGPDGKVTEHVGPPTDFSEAYRLAQSAAIISHVEAPCDNPGLST